MENGDTLSSFFVSSSVWEVCFLRLSRVTVIINGNQFTLLANSINIVTQLILSEIIHAFMNSRALLSSDLCFQV